MVKHAGGCLCGRVRFEITGPIRDIVFCHCSQCRKAQGSAYASNANVAAADFRFLSGESALTGFASSADQTKYFCRHCGSPILSRKKSAPDVVRIRLGTLDSDIAEQPVGHIFVGSRAGWEDLDGALPHFDEFEPGRR